MAGVGGKHARARRRQGRSTGVSCTGPVSEVQQTADTASRAAAAGCVSPPPYYGRCEGGPFHGKNLADARTVFPLRVDVATKRFIPAA